METGVTHTTFRNQKLFCTNCGGEYLIQFPIPIDKLPEKIDAFNTLHGDCPKIWVEPKPDQSKSIEKRAMEWLNVGEHGSSSKAMWFCFMGQTGGRDHPYDPDDFKRCYKLLEFVPEWKSRISKLRTLSPQWDKLVDNWDTLTKMYEQNVKENWVNYKDIKMYELIQECISNE